MWKLMQTSISDPVSCEVFVLLSHTKIRGATENREDASFVFPRQDFFLNTASIVFYALQLETLNLAGSAVKSARQGSNRSWMMKFLWQSAAFVRAPDLWAFVSADPEQRRGQIRDRSPFARTEAGVSHLQHTRERIPFSSNGQ